LLVAFLLTISPTHPQSNVNPHPMPTARSGR
jgi:hypothetical protein